MEKRITLSTGVTEKIGCKPGLAGCLKMEPVKAKKSQVTDTALFEPLDPTEPEVALPSEISVLRDNKFPFYLFFFFS